MIAFASSLDQAGPMAKSSEDLALMMNVMAGFDSRDSTSLQRDKEDYTRDLNKPLAGLRMQKAEGANATVTLCHTGTPDIAAFTRDADIVVAAMGRPKTITADMIREGPVVIDVGVNRVEDASRKSGYRLVGDPCP